MSEAWIFAPVAVGASSILFIDRRPQYLRALGFVLLFGGIVAMFAVIYLVATSEDHARAQCASRGGVPVNGDCWIGGVKQ